MQTLDDVAEFEATGSDPSTGLIQAAQSGKVELVKVSRRNGSHSVS